MSANLATDTTKQQGGFTYSPATGQLLKIGSSTGYAVAIPGTQHVVGTTTVSPEAFADAVADLVERHPKRIDRGAVVCARHSQQRGVYIAELTDILPWSRRVATLMGWMRNQEAIVDLATGETIPTVGEEGP